MIGYWALGDATLGNGQTAIVNNKVKNTNRSYVALLISHWSIRIVVSPDWLLGSRRCDTANCHSEQQGTRDKYEYVEDRIVIVFKYILRNMCFAIMAPVSSLICVKEWRKSTNTFDLKCANVFSE
jgi:hypothetical protein